MERHEVQHERRLGEVQPEAQLLRLLRLGGNVDAAVVREQVLEDGARLGDDELAVGQHGRARQRVHRRQALAREGHVDAEPRLGVAGIVLDLVGRCAGVRRGDEGQARSGSSLLSISSSLRARAE